MNPTNVDPKTAPNLRCPVCGMGGWSDCVMVQSGHAVPLCCPTHWGQQDDAKQELDEAAYSEFLTYQWYASMEATNDDQT